MFAVGGSYYGIADLEAFARQAPKFQAHYLDQLVGPYPEALPAYRARSPLHFADRIASPVILIHGRDDSIVPASQPESMARALEGAGVVHRCLVLSGEGHGFRRSESVRVALEAELRFYVETLGLGLHGLRVPESLLPADSNETRPRSNL